MSDNNGLPFEEMKEGSLKRMLKVKKDDKPLRIGELQKLSKVATGTSTSFRGNDIKITPLMKKRVVLAINLIRASKGKKKK
jgi:hypothetical protein